MDRVWNGVKISLMEGDLTEQATDAIVNAANSQLVLGGGVAGAIRTKGGPSIQAECDRIGPTPVGGAALTGGGKLKARHVIHAVGPRWGEGDEEAKLGRAVTSSLEAADGAGLKSIAFPAISTGIFGFPLELAAEVMAGAIRDYTAGETGLERIVICLFGREALRAFEAATTRLDS